MKICAVPGCGKPAAFEVILYDVYLPIRNVYFRPDQSCPYLCPEHMAENEAEAEGTREPRARMRYPHTNRNQAQGFTIYRPLTAAPRATRRANPATTVVEVSWAAPGAEAAR